MALQMYHHIHSDTTTIWLLLNYLKILFLFPHDLKTSAAYYYSLRFHHLTLLLYILFQLQLSAPDKRACRYHINRNVPSTLLNIPELVYPAVFHHSKFLSTAHMHPLFQQVHLHCHLYHIGKQPFATQPEAILTPQHPASATLRPIFGTDVHGATRPSVKVPSLLHFLS